MLPLLLREALAGGLRAGHILMDSWFCTPKVIRSIKDLGVETIGMVRKNVQNSLYFLERSPVLQADLQQM